MKYSLLWLIASFIAVYGLESLDQRQPIISYISEDKEVEIGSSVELECVVEYVQHYKVLWLRNESGTTQDLLISTNAALIIRDSRYSVRHDKRSASYVLQIRDLQQFDGGLFMCQVSTENNEMSRSVNLLVKQPPNIFHSNTSLRLPIISYISEDKEVEIGSSVELKCAVQYVQNYEVLWLRKESGTTQDLLISTNAALIIRDSRYSVRHDKRSASYILQIRDLQQYDGGLFMCQVSTENNEMSRSVNLLVKQPPNIFHSNASLRLPIISYISEGKEVEIGSSVELECAVEYVQNYTVLWLKQGSRTKQDLLISSNATLIISDSRYSITHDQKSTSYILRIRDLLVNDAGIFICRVLTPYDEISRSVYLLVKHPPIIANSSTTRIKVVMKGKLVQLKCYVTGVPSPKVSWGRENNASLPTRSVVRGYDLFIPNIKKEDQGMYYCIASNGVGKAARSNVSVKVEFDPIVTSNESTVQQAQTFDAILECHVEANPPADINWMFNAQVLVPNSKYRIEFTTEDGFAESVLTVMGVSKRDYGNYTCLASNRLNVVNTSIVLEEMNSTVCSPACNTSYSLSESSARLTTASSVQHLSFFTSTSSGSSLVNQVGQYIILNCVLFWIPVKLAILV